ncbi:C-C motif chemokine 13-like [Delphinapterus leucas]|uniref:C-C motif chemokine 13-like n=1 Tax=Delphinapterus leucas TaxID=9749 RepID=A0A2Y9MZK5_DELLE|nr:C-C motif chemokine 13-like [Delphinapterus leucas]
MLIGTPPTPQAPSSDPLQEGARCFFSVTLFLDAPRDLFNCCFTFNHKKIPLQRLKSYGITSSQCPQAAALFRTKLAKDIGANPKEKWVWNYMKHLGQKPHSLKTRTLSATLRPSQRLRNDSSPPGFLSLSWTKLT